MTWLTPRRAPAAVVALWGVTRLVLLVLALNPDLYHGAVTGDVRGYGAKVERMLQGELPYRDVAIEYPPGSVPFTLLPGILVGTGAHYRLAFALTMLAVDAVGLWGAFRFARAADPSPSRWRVPLAYVVATSAVGPIAYLRFDYVPAVAALLAAVFAAERRPGPAAAALGFGTAAKLFPVVLAPLLVLGLVPALGWRRSLLRTVPAFLLAFAIPVVPALIISAQGTFDWVIGYHLDRGVQIESLWANAIMLGHHLGGLPAVVGYEFGAFDLLSPWSAAAKSLSGPFTLAALAGAAWLTWRRSSSDGGLAPRDVPAAFAAGVLAFMLSNRVLSPQYLVWVMPLLAAMTATIADPVPRDLATSTDGDGRRPGRGGVVRHWARLARAATAAYLRRGPAAQALALAVVTALLTQLIFPFRYDQLRGLGLLEAGLLTLRNVLLIGVAGGVAASLWRAPSTVRVRGFRLSQRRATIR